MNYLLNPHRGASLIQRWLSRAIDGLTVALYRQYKRRSPTYYIPHSVSSTPSTLLPSMSDSVGMPTYGPSPYDELPMIVSQSMSEADYPKVY